MSTLSGEAETVSLRVESDARTHEGRVRERNEDSFLSREENGLWIVADGMGGHENGEWASSVLTEKLGEAQLPEDFDEACKLIAECIYSANDVIYAEARQRGKQMGSTVVGLYVQGRRFAVLWVGDSRCYLYREGALIQVSRDHSQVQEMVDRGLLDPGDAEGHPMGHVLARAVGVQGAITVDAIVDEVQPGDIFLLCSDGLHGYVAEADIERMLSRADPRQTTQSLIGATLDRGAPDNVTVIAVMFTEPTILSIPASATAA